MDENIQNNAGVGVMIDPSFVVPVTVNNQQSTSTGILACCGISSSNLAPIQVTQFANLASVISVFGSTSPEAIQAGYYFSGANTKFRVPPYMYFVKFDTTGSTTASQATNTINTIVQSGTDIAIIYPVDALGDPQATSGNLVFQAIATAVDAAATNNNLLAFFAYDYSKNSDTPPNSTLNKFCVSLKNTAVFYEPLKNPYTCILAASVFGGQDYTQLNNATTIDFKSANWLVDGTQGGTANVTTVTALADASIYRQLRLNFYGNYKLNNNSFNFLQEGYINPFPTATNGSFAWIDNLMSAIWIERNIQTAIFTLFATVQQEPNSPAGYAIVKGVIGQVLDQAKTAGIIAVGVDLSSYAAQYQTLYGIDVTVLSNNGWYIIANPATASQRAARTAGQWIILYVKGNAIQQLPITINQLN